MAATEIKIRVPSFPDIEAVKAAQKAKREQTRAQDLYPRDGSKALSALERKLAGLFGVRPDNLILYNTGMSAAVDALEVIRPTMGTLILRGEQLYSQTGNYISDDLKGRGVKVYETDAGSIPGIEKDLTVRRPDIVFFETVTNGSSMAILEVERFLSLPILAELDPLIILDNTLPTVTAMPLGVLIGESARKIIVVESGTKYLGMNTEMCGLSYTANTDLLVRLRERKQRTGSLLSVSALETVKKVKPKTAERFHQRNRSIFGNTLRLARACSVALGKNNGFEVVHPNLPAHPNSKYANLRSPEGISPVFFLVPEDLGVSESYYQLADKLRHHPLISALTDLGQSFGFDRTRIWPDDNSPILRISGGVYAQKEQTELERAFYEALGS